MNILGIEIDTDGQYKSDSYSMFVGSGNAEYNKEFTKTFYINDKIKRLEKVRELSKMYKSHSKQTFIDEDFYSWNKYFKTIELYINACKSSMFFNHSTYDSIKRQLEIEVYCLEIIEKANLIYQNNNFEAINYLIDIQYKTHKNIFDEPKNDLIYRSQYNALIYDIIQLEINKLSNIEAPEIKPQQNEIIKNGLSQKQIALLFKCLFELDVFTKKLINSDNTKQAKLIALMAGIDISEKPNNWNFYKYWNSVQSINDDKQILKKSNLEIVLNIAKTIDFKELEDNIIKKIKELN
ncbi:hypothetical protein [Flavobacterium oreochromis]|uniref:Uncharacterized protein n=1 Tax=Flavobacterium columnare TaxID=996 RepID=A0A246GG07_9FLAO|nr:hypothetical protein [Flavobacterium oreochromis]OWP79736.1 hypothetical protein BWK62_00415 [Flavobacterium oreochromis]